MATEADNTALVALSWTQPDKASVEIRSPIDHSELVATLRGDDYAIAAIDVPFGWPSHFIEMTNAHQQGAVPRITPGTAEATTWRKKTVAMRRTDVFVADVYGKRTGTAAFDKLGATVAAWALIESELSHARGKRFDRTGQEPDAKGRRIVETYPAAQLNAWIGKPGKPDFARLVEVLEKIGIEVNWGKHEETLTSNGHVRDAFICALTAMKCATDPDNCHAMTDDAQSEQSRSEGVIWVHDRRFAADCSRSWDPVTGFPTQTKTRT